MSYQNMVFILRISVEHIFHEMSKKIVANRIFKENNQLDILLSNSLKLEIDKRGTKRYIQIFFNACILISRSGKKVVQLSELLISDLQNPTIKSSETRQIIILLRKLGLTHKARQIYLQTRSLRIEKEIKKLKMEGGI